MTHFGFATGEVIRGGDGMEVIMATETTKVKKMDDNCTMRGKEYSKRALGGLGNGEGFGEKEGLEKKEKASKKVQTRASTAENKVNC